METAAWIIGLMAGCLRGMYDHEFMNGFLLFIRSVLYVAEVEK
jgi:hypothetical protein